MFGSLFIKECKMWLKSIVFYAYIIILFMFYVTNMDISFIKPQEGGKDYGYTYSEDESVIMNETLKDLIYDYDRETFATYPMGFYKEVHLSDSELKSIGKCISELTGMEEAEWKDEFDRYNQGIKTTINENGEMVTEEEAEWNLFVSEGLSYDAFKKVMKKVTGIVGKGSDYEEDKLASHAIVAKTFDQAMEDYEEIVQKDKVTGAFARLFSDYMGIMLGILPAFFAVTRVIKEKRARVSEVIYSKGINSLVVVSARYLAMVLMMFIPLLLISAFSLTQAAYLASGTGVTPDYLAYIKYCTGWLLPTLMFVCALSYLVAELTESVLSILLSGAVWFVFMFIPLSGSKLIYAGWNLIPRFNELGEYHVFSDLLPQLIKNRCMYLIVSIALMILVYGVYDLKRKGGLKKWRRS